MRAHAHVRLGHGSKDTAHVRVDTSKFLLSDQLDNWVCVQVAPINHGIPPPQSTVGSGCIIPVDT